MNIKQLRLINYDPLGDKNYQFKPGLNLLYGKNEQGKSLTLDAMVKLLLGKSSKKFTAINRVEENPAEFGGFVSVETESGPDKTTQLHKLQGKETLTDLVGLTADDCQNLFLIRNSDLTIGQNLAEQDQFYTSLTDRLTGLKTQEIAQVKDKLLEMAEITGKTAQFQSTDKNLKLGDRLKQAEQLLSDEGEVTKLLQQDKKQHWSELEAELVNLRQRLVELNSELAQQELALKLQEQQQLTQKITTLKELETQLAPLAQVSQTQLDKLRLAEQNLENAEQDKQELKQEIKDKQQQAAQLKKSLDEVKQKIKQVGQAEQNLQRIQPDLDELIKNTAQLTTYQYKPWQIGCAAGGGLLALALLAYLLQPASFLIGIIIILFGFTGLSCAKYLLYLRQQQQYETQLEQLKLEAAKYGVKGKKVEDLVQQRQTIAQQYDQLTHQETSLKTQQEQILNDISSLQQNKLTAVADKIKQARQQASTILTESNCKSLAEVDKKLSQKRSLTTQQEKLMALISDKLGTPTQNQEPIAYWQEKITLVPEPAPAQKTAQTQAIYDAQKLDKLEAEKTKLVLRMQELNQILSNLKERLRDLEKTLNQVLKDRQEPLVCETMTDLVQAEQELAEFITHHEQHKQTALEIITLLDEIEQTEKEKVEELFGKKSLITQYFSQITQDRYDLVTFDQATHQIKVRLKAEQKILTAEQLSAGTYDQLYFAIRLGLGKKLLKDQTGFFILDDPFLKSDQTRLKQQLQMLEQIAQQGWQVLYFSAKEEVKDYLQDRAEQVIEIKS